jgi:hypothetical protein
MAGKKNRKEKEKKNIHHLKTLKREKVYLMEKKMGTRLPRPSGVPRGPQAS